MHFMLHIYREEEPNYAPTSQSVIIILGKKIIK